MDVKSYRKESFYSYTLGAFPTIELLKKHSKDVLKIIIHSSFKNEEVLNMIADLKGNSEVIINDRLIEKLTKKENCFIIGIFKKYKMRLDENSDHIVLHNPSNMGNFGTILRSALGFHIKDIAIIRPGVDIFDPKVLRSAMGAFFSLSIEYFETYEEYIKRFPEHQKITFMLQAKETLQQKSFDNIKTSLVFGNEATGLPIELLDDNSVLISHSNEIDSLNLPNAVSIALYEFDKQKTRN